MGKVKIDNDRDGWYYYSADHDHELPLEAKDKTYSKISEYTGRKSTIEDIRLLAKLDGHEIDNAGWLHKLLMWNWHAVSIDGYPGWDLPDGRHPAWCRLGHTNKKTKSSEDLQRAWDDLAKVDFYSRDFSLDGSVFVNEGDRYDSGWWFRALAERDRFVAWVASSTDVTVLEVV